MNPAVTLWSPSIQQKIHWTCHAERPQGFVSVVGTTHNSLKKCSPTVFGNVFSTDNSTIFPRGFGRLEVIILNEKRLLPCHHTALQPRHARIVVLCSKQQVLARNSSRSFNVAVGLLAANLTSFLLVFSSVLEGPVLGNDTVVQYFLDMLITVFTVFHGISSVLELLLYPSPDRYLSTVTSHSCFGRSFRTGCSGMQLRRCILTTI